MGSEEAYGEEGGIMARPSDRAGAPSELSPQAVSSAAAHPSRVAFASIARMAGEILSEHPSVVHRLKQWQKFGYWGIAGLGKGNFGRYTREHVEHVAVLCELSNLGVAPERASELARRYSGRVFADADEGELTTIEVTPLRSGFFLDSPRLSRLVDGAFA